MTIQNQASKVVYSADGASKNYTVPFYFLNDEIAVYLNTDINKLIINTDYEIKNKNSNGGEIEFITTPPKDTIITITRDVPLTQLTTFIEGETFPAKDFETSLDKITMSLQMIKEVLDRTIKISPSASYNFDDFRELVADLNDNYDKIKQVPALASLVSSIYEEILNNVSKQIKAGPISVNTQSVVMDGTYSAYPYKLDIIINQATKSHIPTIIFSLEDAISSNFAPLAECYNGFVRIYMKEIPATETIEIPIIFLQ